MAPREDITISTETTKRLDSEVTENIKQVKKLAEAVKQTEKMLMFTRKIYKTILLPRRRLKKM